MTRSALLLAGTLFAALLLVGGIFWARGRDLGVPQTGPETTDEEPELAVLMSQLQYYSHKLVLASSARNEALAAFYLHELEELAETIEQEVPSYEGHPIGRLTGTMLLPEIEGVEEAMRSGGWEHVQDRLESLVRSCNACHAATDHGFIRIVMPGEENPFMQDFGPVP